MSYEIAAFESLVDAYLVQDYELSSSGKKMRDDICKCIDKVSKIKNTFTEGKINHYEYGHMTDDLMTDAEECTQRNIGCGPGDSGEAKCMFCPHCVLSVREIYENIINCRGK